MGGAAEWPRMTEGERGEISLGCCERKGPPQAMCDGNAA